MGTLLEQRTAELVQMQAGCKQLPGSSALLLALRCSASILARRRLRALPALAARSRPAVCSCCSPQPTPVDCFLPGICWLCFCCCKGALVSPKQLLKEHGALAVPPLPDPHESSQLFPSSPGDGFSSQAAGEEVKSLTQAVSAFRQKTGRRALA